MGSHFDGLSPIKRAYSVRCCETTDSAHRPNSFSNTGMTYEKVWRRPADSTNVMFHFAGHLVRVC